MGYENLDEFLDDLESFGIGDLFSYSEKQVKVILWAFYKILTEVGGYRELESWKNMFSKLAESELQVREEIIEWLEDHI